MYSALCGLRKHARPWSPGTPTASRAGPVARNGGGPTIALQQLPGGDAEEASHQRRVGQMVLGRLSVPFARDAAIGAGTGARDDGHACGNTQTTGLPTGSPGPLRRTGRSRASSRRPLVPPRQRPASTPGPPGHPRQTRRADQPPRLRPRQPLAGPSRRATRRVTPMSAARRPPADTSNPATVIGDGSAGCTSAAVVAAVAKGGAITFSCGPAPVTIEEPDRECGQRRTRSRTWTGCGMPRARWRLPGPGFRRRWGRFCGR